MQRGYVLLIKEWLAYMAHLKTRYPYLFSLALRTNPFDPFATPEIQVRRSQVLGSGFWEKPDCQ